MASKPGERDTLLEEGSPAAFSDGNPPGGWARPRPFACFVGLAMLGTAGFFALGAHVKGLIKLPVSGALDDIQELAADTWTFHNPDPSHLVWDTTVKIKPGVIAYDGWLKVPLSHDFILQEAEPSPFVCLRVLGSPAHHRRKRPAKKGVLLGHCGGPGSGRDCPLKMFEKNEDIMANFDLIGIDQRGVNFWGIATNDPKTLLLEPLQKYYDKKHIPPCPWKDAAPFPRIYCDEFSKLMESDLHFVLKALDMENATDSELFRMMDMWKYRGLPGADPNTGLAYNTEQNVRIYYRLMQLEHNLCYKAPRYQIAGKNGRKYNAFHYTGTVDLAHDLEIFRKAIGAHQISIRGASYGTWVAGVYSTIFPRSVDRILMDGAMTPNPDVQAGASADAVGVESVLNGQYIACDNSLAQQLPADEICPAAPAVSRKVLKMLTDSKSPLRASQVYSMLTGQMYEAGVPYTAITMACIQQMWSNTKVPGCPKPLPSTSTQTTPGNSAKSKGKKGGKKKQKPGKKKQKPGKKENGKKKNSHENKSKLVKYPRDNFDWSLQGAVLGLDSAGRLSEEAVISWWGKTLPLFPIGVFRGLKYAVIIGTWPAVPRPMPPLGSGIVAPLIVGNLHDAQTSYSNAQKMKEAYQHGSIMTYQGYGHALQLPKDAAAVVEKYKREVAAGKLPEYTNDIAKLLCGEVAFNYLLTKELPPDGHVCKMATSVPVGSKAASNTTVPGWF